MAYAVRKDGAGFRAVNSPADVLPTETFSSGVPVLPPPLVGRANEVQARRAAGGFTVNFGSSVPVLFGTDALGLALLNGAVSRQALPNPPETVQWQVGANEFVALTGAQVVIAGTLVADFVSDTFEVLRQVLAAIDAGTVTSLSQIDAYDWPANFAVVPA
mgnify:CR=1 FL=1